jgi:glutamate-1-semialdehyde 2,1-aminomutase
MGKVIGGRPVGSYGGSREIMEWVAPAGSMYQAGTLSGNPLAVRAGVETLKKLRNKGTYDELERKSQKLIDGVVTAAKKHGHAMTAGCAGGMFNWFFQEGPVRTFADAQKTDSAKFAKWHRMMLERGVYMSPSLKEAGLMSAVHTDIDKTIAIADEVLSQL